MACRLNLGYGVASQLITQSTRHGYFSMTSCQCIICDDAQYKLMFYLLDRGLMTTCLRRYDTRMYSRSFTYVAMRVLDDTYKLSSTNMYV